MPGGESESISIETVAQRAREASRQMLKLTPEDRNKALQLIHDEISAAKEEILKANIIDKQIAEQRKKRVGDISTSLIKRLELGGAKFTTLLQGIESVITLDDPVNQCQLSRELDEGLQLYKISCPIGVIGVIFESRPEAVIQIVSLIIKSSNVVILKGGKEAEHSNNILVQTIHKALAKLSTFPEHAVQLISTREHVNELLDQSSYIDLMIPRGSNQLVKFIQDNTKIPVMGHADGLCSIYLDEFADMDKSVKIIVDSKSQYPAVCNATETLLVHEDIVSSDKAIDVVNGLLAKNVEMKCDLTFFNYILDKHNETFQRNQDKIVKADTSVDYDTEFLDYIISIKVVKSMNDAIQHINKHGSGHTDCILSENTDNVKVFLNTVDSAGVFHNASTRFADGFRFGFGAEVGVSTHRIHARGPVGLEGLMIYKYKVLGDGHIVAPYASGEKQFTHKDTPDVLPSI